MCSQPQVRSPSITSYPPFTFFYLPAPTLPLAITRLLSVSTNLSFFSLLNPFILLTQPPKHSKISQPKKKRTIWFHFYVESNEQNKLTHKIETDWQLSEGRVLGATFFYKRKAESCNNKKSVMRPLTSSVSSRLPPISGPLGSAVLNLHSSRASCKLHNHEP